MNLEEKIIESGIDSIVLFSNCSYDTAFIGVTEDNRAVYDYRKMVAWLIENDGMTEEEAEEWIGYNTIETLQNAGSRAPIIIYPLV